MEFSETSVLEPVKQLTNDVNVNNNQMLTYILSFLFILYAGVATPTIPDNIVNIFKNPLFKLSILVVIGYVAMKDPIIAVIITMIILVIGHRMSCSKVKVLKETKTKQDVKAEAIVKAETHMAAAEDANTRGAVEEVKAHLQQVAKLEAKVDAILKADAHRAAAEDANTRGAIEEVKAHLQQVAKLEAKVDAIVKAEIHMAAAEEANTRGAVEEVKAHLKEIAKLEAKVDAIVETIEIDTDIEMNGIPSGITDDSHAPYLNSSDISKITLPDINTNTVSDVSGYDYIDYATV
jgi:hypothetical protein